MTTNMKYTELGLVRENGTLYRELLAPNNRLVRVNEKRMQAWLASATAVENEDGSFWFNQTLIGAH